LGWNSCLKVRCSKILADGRRASAKEIKEKPRCKMFNPKYECQCGCRFYEDDEVFEHVERAHGGRELLTELKDDELAGLCFDLLVEELVSPPPKPIFTTVC
jgi:hypothetical protein